MIKQFNDDWEFAKEGGEYAPVELPHDAMIAEKRYASCRNASQSGYFPGGKYRYRKKFELTADEAEKKVGLLFEGVYRNCEVYVNGRRINTATENLPWTSVRLSAGASTLWK